MTHHFFILFYCWAHERFHLTKPPYCYNNQHLFFCRVILGPFLLTHLLMDLLVTAAHMTGDARIINVTCSAHDTEKISGILSFWFFYSSTFCGGAMNPSLNIMLVLSQVNTVSNSKMLNLINIVIFFVIFINFDLMILGSETDNDQNPTELVYGWSYTIL